MTIGRARLALRGGREARAAAERAAMASAAGNGTEHPRTVSAQALRDSIVP